METKSETKHCGKCGRDLPLSEFYVSKVTGKYQAWCKDCQKARCRKKSFNPEIKAREVDDKINKVINGIYSNRIAKLVEEGRKQEEEKKKEEKKPQPVKPIQPSIGQMISMLRQDKEFDLKDWFTPRELINALYDLGYRGELSIMIEHKVKLSHEENSSTLFTH